MNFLQLTQRLWSEAGLSGSGPSSVVGQTGDALRAVNWINSAYMDVVTRHVNWRFLEDDFSFNTVVNQQAYTPAQAGITDLGSWGITEWRDARCYIAEADEQYLQYVQWDEFRELYLFGSLRSIIGRPVFISFKPDQSLILHPTPELTSYNIVGHYYKRWSEMTTNTQEPLIPTQYRMIIVWRALMYYGAYDAADERYSHGQNEYLRMLGPLEMNMLPAVTWGEPLA